MIADILKDEIPSVPSEGSIEMASRILQKEDITEIVVTEDGRFVYMLRELDLISSSGEKIQEITSAREGYFAYEEEHFLKSIQKMHVNDLSILPVVDTELKYLGALRKDDLLDYLCDQYTVSENESIIIIEQAMRDYSLAALSRIVEEEGGKVLGVFIGPSKFSSEKVWVSLTIQTGSLQKTVSSLERHEYDIIAHMSGEENETMMKERYESLMTFLNV
jgi:predicted transcriptional regulator